MSSRKECDDAFRYLGYRKFDRVPKDVLYKRIDELGYNSVKETNRDIIMGVRCNSICDDMDPSDQCNVKISDYFDRVESSEYCSKSVNFNECIIEIVEKSEMYLGYILRINYYGYSKLLNHGYYIIDWDQLNLNFITLPIPYTHRRKYKYMISPKLLYLILSNDTYCYHNLNSCIIEIYYFDEYYHGNLVNKFFQDYTNLIDEHYVSVPGNKLKFPINTILPIDPDSSSDYIYLLPPDLVHVFII